MCGIGGFLINENSGLLNKNNILESMSIPLMDRGPDNIGFWNNEKNIFLFHTRLSIIDLSKNGDQPMLSENGRYIISYNGEIYNYKDINYELQKEGVVIKASSDTKVILEAISKWGIEKALSKFIGMFSIALWDNYKEELYLIRDRIGIKPLYWKNINGTFVFASTLNSILKFKSENKINNEALSKYLRYGYIPAPFSIFQNTFKVKPGTFVRLKLGEKPKEKIYWSLSKNVKKNFNKKVTDFNKTVEHFDALLNDSIKLRMISDVPIGSFLSGGVDSTIVTAIMQKNSIKKIKSFSIGFEDSNFNEATDAKKVAKFLKTDHHELYIKDQDILNLIPEIHSYYDEPFFDSSCIPTYILSKFAKKSVTVALSGDGGDELFGGYNRYLWGERFSKFNSITPTLLRKCLSRGLKIIPPIIYDKLTYKFQKMLGIHAAGYKIHKLADCLTSIDDNDMYLKLISHWKESNLEMTNNFIEKHRKLSSIPKILDSTLYKMQYYDLETYLNADILTKVDRASMSNSLEVRVPIIDHRIVESSWRLPKKFKINNGETKYLLKEVLKKYVPKKYFDRPKMGFGIPLDSWLRNQLFDWGQAIIEETDWENLFQIDKNFVLNSWESFNLHGSPSSTHIWILLSLGAWSKNFSL